MVSAPNLCVICKGSRLLCGQKSCPVIKTMAQSASFRNIGEDFSGPSTSVFVGRYGYPNVFVGPVAPLSPESLVHDNPSLWFGREYSDIIGFRSSVLRSKNMQNIFSRSRFVGMVQEVALSSKPVDVEMLFSRKPSFRMLFSDVLQPMGPSVTLKKLSLVGNTRIKNHIEKLTNDEIKASEAGYSMYSRGEDVYKISTILSSGALGLEKNKKLVPTRYSITAVDDMLCKRLISDIKANPSINDYLVYSSEYLSNHFEILLMPGNWEYENFEVWSPGSVWTASMKKPVILEEYEPFSGRTKYAEQEGGGYYAARLPVAEALHGMKRQACVVVFREVYEGYVIPMGVWVVRESVRNAFKNKPFRFATKDEALKHISSRLRMPLRKFVEKSVILRQRRLNEF